MGDAMDRMNAHMSNPATYLDLASDVCRQYLRAVLTRANKAGIITGEQTGEILRIAIEAESE